MTRPLYLNITRGLPGVGKTTITKDWIRAFAERGLASVRVNRDDLRLEVYGEPVLSREQENTLTKIQQARVRGLLDAGIEVFVDDTNLNMKTVKTWQRMARDTGAIFNVIDYPVNLDLAIARNAARIEKGERGVPEEVIRRMYKRYNLHKGLPEVTPIDDTPITSVYEHPLDKPTAWIFDMDGTLTTGPKNRSPYDYTKVHQDEPRYATIDVLRRLYAAGDKIIVLSGREDSCAEETLLWMVRHGISAHALHMRATGDTRKDAMVKAEIFDKHVRHDFNVLGVFDDRDQVVDFWRSIGLTVFQPERGNF